MSPILKNILAIVIAVFVGSTVNMAILEIGQYVVPNPKGFDDSTMESMAATVYLLKPQNFIHIFLAHSLGTLTGAYLATKIAVSNHIVFSLIVSILFFVGGIFMTTILPSPEWFNFTDLIAAYVPMWDG